MANYCFNNVFIHDVNNELFEKLVNWLDSYNDFNYFTEWGNSLTELKETDGYAYGTKWWDFSYDVERNSVDNTWTINLYGDSAWSPPEELIVHISGLGCEVSIEYCEWGCYFAGDKTYYHGELKESWEGCPREFMYRDNQHYAMEYTQEEIETDPDMWPTFEDFKKDHTFWSEENLNNFKNLFNQ